MNYRQPRCPTSIFCQKKTTTKSPQKKKYTEKNYKGGTLPFISRVITPSNYRGCYNHGNHLFSAICRGPFWFHFDNAHLVSAWNRKSPRFFNSNSIYWFCPPFKWPRHSVYPHTKNRDFSTSRDRSPRCLFSHWCVMTMMAMWMFLVLVEQGR